MTSVWRSIANWTNPTRTWREDLSKSLLLDLDTHRFCGVGIGEPAQTLSFLGPATRWSYLLEFPNHGLAIQGDSSITELNYYFGHREERSGGTFRGGIRHRGEALTLSATTTEEELLALFGQPYWRDADDDETILFYEFPEREWQVEFGTDGRLKCFVLGLPILTDPVQREAYGVSKTWPPAHREVGVSHGRNTDSHG
jgi:hypothetical protein